LPEHLRNSFQNVLSLIETLEEVRCFSLSYCSFSPAEIRHVVNVAAKCIYLKTLGIQRNTHFLSGYTKINLAFEGYPLVQALYSA
jgi:hypothetical protein